MNSMGNGSFKMDKNGNINDNSQPDQGAVITIDLNDAISYNSVIELKNVFSRRNP